MPIYDEELPLATDGIKFRSLLAPPPDAYARPAAPSRASRAAARQQATAAKASEKAVAAAAPLPDAYAPRFEDTEARRRTDAAQQYETQLATANEADRKAQLRETVHNTPVIEQDPVTGTQRPKLNAQGQVDFGPPPITPDPRIGQAVSNDAYAPRQVQIPNRPTSPLLQHKQSVAATKMQTAEDRRAAGVTRGLKAQGVEMITDLATGVQSPKKDMEGRTIYKPSVVSPLEDRGQGNFVSVHRDRYGNEQDVPLAPKIDKQTGEKYVISADGVSRVSLGIDQDYVLRKDAAEASKIAGQARSELGLIKSQQTELKTQIEDYGGQAAMIAQNKNATPEDKAKLKQIQADRQNAVKQLDQLKEMHAAKAEEAQAATGEFLDKRKLIIDKLKANQEPPNFETKLTPNEESQFQYWKKQFGIKDDGRNYDYRGAFKAGVQPDVTQHWPDTFKKPNHPTFSEDSKYASAAPDKAGAWDAAGNFVPPSGEMMTNVAAQKALSGDVAAEKQLSSDPNYTAFKSELLGRVRSKEITPEEAGRLNQQHLHEIANQPQPTRLAATAQASLSATDPGAAASAIQKEITTAPKRPFHDIAQSIKGFFYPLFGPNKEQQQHVYNSIQKDMPTEHGLIPSLSAYVSTAASIPNFVRGAVLTAQGKEVTPASLDAYRQQEREAVGLAPAKGDSKPWAVTKGVANSLLNAAEAIVNPAFLSLPSNRVISGLFSAQMLSGVPEALGRIKSEPTLQGKVSAATDAAVDLLAGGYAARHAMDSSAIGAASRKTWTGSTDTAEKVREAVKAAKAGGVSPEFRSFFGGIDPEIAGTTPEKVAAFAKSLGMEWKPTPKPETPPEAPADGTYKTASGSVTIKSNRKPPEPGDTPPPSGGAPVAPNPPTAPQGPLSEADISATIDQLRGDAQTHIADLQGEKAMLQTEIDDPATSTAMKAAHLTRIAELDQEISAVSALHPNQTNEGSTNNETRSSGSQIPGQQVSATGASPEPQKPAAQRPDTPVPAPGTGGAAENRPVPDKTKAQVPDQPRADEVPQQKQGQGNAPKAGSQPSDSLAADEGLLKTEPALAKTAKSVGLAYGGVHAGDNHTFTDKKTGTSVTVPFGTTPKELLAKVAESRANIEKPANKEISDYLADKNPMAIANEGGISPSAAVAMAIKLVGEQALSERAAKIVKERPKNDWSSGLDRPEAAREILAEHKASTTKSVDTGSKLVDQLTVDAAAHEAATSPQNKKPIPSLAQHEGDNAELGHSSIGGMPISFENPVGSIRTNVDMKAVREIANDKADSANEAAVQLLRAHKAGDEKAASHVAQWARAMKAKGRHVSKGEPWANKMVAHYGRFKGIKGADGDLLDAFVKEGTPRDYDGLVHVVVQNDKSGNFDENKVVLGPRTPQEALNLYNSHYPAGWKGAASVRTYSMEEFKKWTREGDMKQPAPKGQYRYAEKAIAHGRANRLLTEAMAKGKAKATLKALDVEIVIVKGEAAMEMKAIQQAGTNIIHYRLALNTDRIDERTSHMSDEAAREYVTKGLSEELIHAAQFEAARLTWNGKGKFDDHFQSEYEAVESSMTDEERAAVWEAYGSGIQGGKLGAEFVRQLIQTDREGAPTEATIRAKGIIERILAVLKKLLDNAASWSEALKRAYDRTSAVLDSIEKAEKQRKPNAKTEQTKTPPATSGSPAPAERPLPKPGDTGAKAPGAVQGSGASDALKAQAKKAFEGLFAPEPDPNEQVSLPKERRAAFFNLADSMEGEGITTPEKVAQFLEETFDGKMRKYSQALWATMEASGAVTPQRPDWPAIYLALKPNEAQIAAGANNEPDTRTGNLDAGVTATGQADNVGQGQPGGQISGGAVSPEELAGGGSRAGADSGQPGSPGQSGARDTTPVAGGNHLADPNARSAAGDNRPTATTGSDAGPAGAAAAGSTGPGTLLADQNHVIEPGQAIAPSGAVAKLKANVGAVKLLKSLEAAKRNPSPEEKQKLAQYTGWGQFKGAFDTIRADRRGSWQEDSAWTSKWGATYDQLKKILTPEEWNTAAESTLNAHYTAPEEISAMWDIARRLGFAGGRVLEPAIGVGHFFGLMPQDMAGGSKLFGLDMDAISSRIAQKLYPQADIKTGRFEKAKLPSNYFDLTISNFPFHEVGPGDARYPKLNLHNYFFARSFDLAKPGGLVVAITSNSTLDNNPEQRAYLQGKADLVAAIRLPNTAFLANAGTEVTTDILIFRKPDGTPFKGESFLNTVQLGTKDGKPIVANEYFQRHPEMALGKHSLEGTQYRADSYALIPDKYRPLEPALKEAIATLPTDLVGHAENFYANQDFGIVRSGEKEGSISFKDGKPLQVVWSQYMEPAWTLPQFRSRTRDPKTRIAMAKSFVALRDKMKELQAAELSEGFDESGPLRGELKKLYDAHVKKFGNLEKGNMKFLEDDPEYYLVMGLETVERERRGDTFERVIRQADMLTQRTLYPTIPPTSASDVKDAAMISMQFRGKIDLGYMAQLTGRDEAATERDLLDTGLAFKNPVTGLMETRDLYLSSNVRQKLREAEAAAKDDQTYQKNVEELTAIQPGRVSFENIKAKAGSAWIPPEVYTAFAKKILGASAKVTYSKPLDRWSVSLGHSDIGLAENTSTYGTERATGVDILTDVLNLKNPTVTDQEEYYTDAGNKAKRTVVNRVETDKARDKARRIKSEFSDHASSDPEARDAIENTYNDTFNSYVVPTFDGLHMVFPGMASTYKGKPLLLRPHQKDVVYRITQVGGTLMAHGVGGGKTLAQIAAVMELRRLGQARKPLVVVDKPTIGQFAATWRQAYPNANILVATQDSFSASNRKRFMSRIATGNWDAVIMANSQFDLMPSDPAVVQAYVQTHIDQLREIAADMEHTEGKGSAKVRQIQTEIKRLENRLDDMLSKLGKRQDDTIYFEQSGVDALFIDEAHRYKKVPFTTKMDPVKGLDRNPSQAAINLHTKIQFVHQKNRGRNVVTATGTPVTNTLAEAYNMTRLVAPDLLEQWNVDTFDKFISTFAEVEDSTEMNAAGRWVSVERLKKFINGPELVKLIRTGWDVRMGEDLKGLNLPTIRGGKPRLIAFDPTDEQQQITDFLNNVYDQFQALTGKERRAFSWVPVVTMQLGMAAATDPRLVDPALPYNANGVVGHAIQDIARGYHTTMAAKSTQIVFLDRYRPMTTEKLKAFASGEILDPHAEDLGSVIQEKSTFNLYNDIRDRLVALGIPRDEIAIAHEHDTDLKRIKMQEDMNTGRIRVLMGSTAKIGQGINVQDKLLEAYHLDPPLQMTPAQYIQRNGRIIRDGNEHSEVGITTYGPKRTMAAGIWDRIEKKAKFIVQVLMGKGVGREFEDPADEVTMSIAEQVAELTGDNRILRKVALETEVRNLETAKEAHFNNVGSARSKLRQEHQTLAHLQNSALPKAKTDKAFFEANFGEDKPLVLKVGAETVLDAAAFDERFKSVVKAAEEKGPSHFDVNPKHFSVHYKATAEINGLKLESTITIYNRKDINKDADVTTHFLSPTATLDHSYAKTGKGLIVVAKDIAERNKAGERITGIEQHIEKTRTQISKLTTESEKTFTQGDELAAKTTELQDLIRDLSAPRITGQGGTITATPDGGEFQGLRAPEPDAKRGALVSAFKELPTVEQKVVTMKLAGASDAEIAKAVKITPLAVNTAYQIALQKLDKARTTGATVKSKFRQVVAEKSGERTLGRPELANPAQGPMSRRLVDTVDQLRKEAGIPGTRKDTDVAAAAQARLDKDYEGERRALFKRAAQGGMFDGEETLMAKRIVAKEALSAVKTNSQSKMLAAAKLIDAYRMTGTEQARAFRQRQDFTMSPEDRAAEYLSEALLTPDRKRLQRMEKLEEPSQREEALRDWIKQVERIKKQLAKLGIDLDAMSEDEIRAALKDPVKAVRAIQAVNAAKADIWDKLYEWWVSSILSLPSTQIANLVGNVGHAGWEFTVQRFTEAAINQIPGIGHDPNSAQFGEFKHMVRAIMPGLERASRNFLKSWRTELPVFEEEVLGSRGHEKVTQAQTAIEGQFGRTVRTPLRSLRAVDEYCKSIFGQLQAAAEAFRIAKGEGLTGAELDARVAELQAVDSENPSLAWTRGAKESVRLAFQDELGSMGKAVINFRNQFPGMRYELPFVHTLSKIFSVGVRKTPVGSAQLLWNVGRVGLVKMNALPSGEWEYTRTDFVRHFAEQLLAWGITLGLLSYLTAPNDEDGLPRMTGTTPYQGTKRGERDLAYRTAPPMSVKIGSSWYSYGRIEPFATSLALTIDLLNEARKVKNGEDFSAAIGHVLTHVAAQIKDKTFARGIGDFMNAIEDGEHVVEWAGNFATSWVPNIVRGSARETDPVIREQKAWGRGEEWFGNFIDQLKYKALPLANEVIQPKIDLWGRVIEKDKGISPATDWLFRMVAPARTQPTGKVLDVDRAITNFNNAHPGEVFAPQPPPPTWQKKIDGKEHTFYMDRQEYRQFLEMSGAAALGRIEILNINPAAPTQKDMEAIGKALEKSRKEAREQLWEQRLRRQAAA